MSLWTLVKTAAALMVGAIVAITAAIAWHVAVHPLGGWFSAMIPPPAAPGGPAADPEVARMLDSAEMPDIDPGDRAFQKAHELLALGRLPEAREKLEAIVNVFPGSTAAPEARRIVGNLNLDEILSTSHMPGKRIHTVRRGDSLLGIAEKQRTSIECLMQLNSMMELRALQPGDELVVMPLEFRLLIETRRRAVSLWDGGRFIREYPVLAVPGAPPAKPQRTTIASRTAEFGEKRVNPQSRDFRAAAKTISLAKPTLRIRGWDGTGDKPPGAVLLAPPDMEELFLLTRNGNTAEVR